jgi:nucleotide-sensitive chloride channel 1A
MPAAALISSVPSFVSPEEHRALVGSTPPSFNDILPVLRYKEENVSVTLEPVLQGFSAQDAAQGTLFVIERSLPYSDWPCLYD